MGSAGEILRCSSCDSIRHLLADCPDSYENLRKFRSMALAAHVCEKEGDEENKTREEEEEEAYFTGDLVENLRKMSKEELEGLVRETLGCLLLDCGCSKNVAGEGWWKSYKASLPKCWHDQVKETKSDGRRFRFGGDEVLTSTKVIRFPAMIAGRLVTIESHIVKSKIPLLWSRSSMKKAGTVLDLPEDRAKIFDQWVDLNLTTVGHYSLEILPMNKESAEEALLTLPKERKEKELLATIHSRPVLSLPPASEFQEVLTLDLKSQ